MTEIHNMLVPAYGLNDDDKWALFEEHSECDTQAFDLENDLFIMKCVEHNVPHIITTRQV